MASYAVMIALADFWYSAPAQSLRFSPRVCEEDFACFFSVNSGWGVVTQSQSSGAREAAVAIHAGELVVRELVLGVDVGASPSVVLGGREIGASATPAEGGSIVRFVESVVVDAGETLRVIAEG